MTSPINPQEFNDALAAFSEALRSTTSSVAATQVEFDEFGSELDLSQRQQKARDNALHQAITTRIQKEKEAAQKAVDTWAKVSKASVNVASSMSSQEGAFNMLGNATAMVVKGIGNLASAIPVIGNALKGLGEGAAEAVKLVTEQTGKAFSTFGKISSTGVVTSFKDMRAAAESTGLLYEELDGVLTKNSESLALLGTTSTNGSKMLQNVLVMNKNAAVEAQKMGIAFAEYSEMQASYVSQQTLAGFAKKKSDAELAAGAKAYVYELDMLSKLTGKQRSAIQAEQEALQNNARYRAMLLEVDDTQAKQFQRFISTLPKELQDGATDLLANAGNPVTKAGQELAVQFSQGGLDARQLFSDLRSGSKTVGQGLTEMASASKRSVESTKGLVKVIGTDSIVTKNYIGIADLAKRAGVSIDQVIKDIQDQQEVQKESTDNTAEAANKAHDLAGQMQRMTTSVESVMWANNTVADSLIGLSKIIKQATGNTSPTSMPPPSNSSVVPSGAVTGSSTGIVTRGIGSKGTASMNIGAATKGTGAKGSSFYNQMYATLLDEAKKANIPNPEVIAAMGAAQSTLETGHGKHLVGNNYFGIKAKKGQASTGAVGTTEVINGKLQNVSASFRKYDTMNDSAADYIKFLQENRRYKDVLKATSTNDAISLLGKTGYATDPAYASKLKGIIGNTETASTGSTTNVTTMQSSPTTSEKPSDFASTILSRMSSKYDSMIDLLSRNNSLLIEISRSLA